MKYTFHVNHYTKASQLYTNVIISLNLNHLPDQTLTQQKLLKTQRQLRTEKESLDIISSDNRPSEL